MTTLQKRSAILSTSVDKQKKEHDQLIQAVKLLGECREMLMRYREDEVDGINDDCDDLLENVEDFLGIDGPFPFAI